MKKSLSLLALSLVLPILSSCSFTNEMEGETKTVIDALNREVTISKTASRFACIGPGALRIYSYIGDASAIVGLEEKEINWPDYSRPYILKYGNVKEYKNIGPGGPGAEPNASKLLLAEPDVIFTTYSTDLGAVNKLQEDAKTPVIALTHYTNNLFTESTFNDLRIIGQVTNKEERANYIIDYILNIKKDLNNRTKDIKDKKTAYMGCQNYRGSFGIEATNGSVPSFDALNIINAVNGLDIEGHALITKERLLSLDPECIILDAGGLSYFNDDYSKDKEYYDKLKAFQNNQVFIEMPYNFYSTNIDIALANCYFVGKMVYPEVFTDIDPVVKFDEIANDMLGVSSYEKVLQAYGGYRTFIHQQ